MTLYRFYVAHETSLPVAALLRTGADLRINSSSRRLARSFRLCEDMEVVPGSVERPNRQRANLSLRWLQWVA